jgi:hypothetical protein
VLWKVLQSNLPAMEWRSCIFIPLRPKGSPVHWHRKLVVTWTQIHMQIYLSGKCKPNTHCKAEDENISGATA